MEFATIIHERNEKSPEADTEIVTDTDTEPDTELFLTKKNSIKTGLTEPKPWVLLG